jgi:hypothetical protein
MPGLRSGQVVNFTKFNVNAAFNVDGATDCAWQTSGTAATIASASPAPVMQVKSLCTWSLVI